MKSLFDQVSEPGSSSDFVIWLFPDDPEYKCGDTIDCGPIGTVAVVQTEMEQSREGRFGIRRAIGVRLYRKIT